VRLRAEDHAVVRQDSRRQQRISCCCICAMRYVRNLIASEISGLAEPNSM
jgi:hypothetical protein